MYPLIIPILIITTIIILLLIHHNQQPKYNLTIMAIFKNEHLYMQEWLNHHISNGIQHFYLYSNDPNMSNYPYLQNPIYQKYITIIPWTDKQNNGPDTIQRQAYTHAIQNFNHEYKYIMMLDIDEFITSTDPSKKVIDIINQLDPNTKAVKVQRYNFGSNGHKTKPDGLVQNNYTKRENICSSYKTIANSKYINTYKKFYGVHDFNFMYGGKVYNDYFNYDTGYPNQCTNTSINEIPLIINHYYTKSYDEYIERCKLWKDGGVNTVGYRKDCEKMFKERDNNEYDTQKN